MIKRILALALAFTLLLAGCSQGEQKEEKPQLVLQNAAKAIKEHSDADTVEILALEPAPQPPEYYALVQLTDDAGAVSKRFYHLSLIHISRLSASSTVPTKNPLAPAWACFWAR